MKKRNISIVITMIFTLFLTGPTVISLVDDSYDLSVFYSINEEENNQKEITKHLEVKFLESLSHFENVIFADEVVYETVYQNLYSMLSLKNISPPPEIG